MVKTDQILPIEWVDRVNLKDCDRTYEAVCNWVGYVIPAKVSWATNSGIVEAAELLVKLALEAGTMAQPNSQRLRATLADYCAACGAQTAHDLAAEAYLQMPEYGSLDDAKRDVDQFLANALGWEVDYTGDGTPVFEPGA